MTRLTLFAVSMAWFSAGCASQYEAACEKASLWEDRFVVASGADPAECQRVDCSPSEYGADSYQFSNFDEKALESKLRDCASEALSVIEDVTGQEFNEDFEYGFVQAFVDLSQNRKGITPAVPPPRYWNAYYRAPQGHQHVYDWYAGYELGTQEAFRAGIHTWTEVVSLAALYGMSGPGCIPANYVHAAAPPAMNAQQPVAAPRPVMLPQTVIPQQVVAMPQPAAARQVLTMPAPVIVRQPPMPQPVVVPQTFVVPQPSAAPPVVAVQQPVAARPQAHPAPRHLPARPAIAARPPVVRGRSLAALPARPQADYRQSAVTPPSNRSVSYRQATSAVSPTTVNPEMDYRTSASHTAIMPAGGLPATGPASSPSVRGY